MAVQKFPNKKNLIIKNESKNDRDNDKSVAILSLNFLKLC